MCEHCFCGKIDVTCSFNPLSLTSVSCSSNCLVSWASSSSVKWGKWSLSWLLPKSLCEDQVNFCIRMYCSNAKKILGWGYRVPPRGCGWRMGTLQTPTSLTACNRKCLSSMGVFMAQLLQAGLAKWLCWSWMGSPSCLGAADLGHPLAGQLGNTGLLHASPFRSLVQPYSHGDGKGARKQVETCKCSLLTSHLLSLAMLATWLSPE